MGHDYGMLATLALGLPLAAGIAALVFHSRVRRGWDAAWAGRAGFAELAMVVGTLPWVWMILRPAGGSGGVQLVPFRDLSAVLQGDQTFVQIVGNLLVFAALGFFLPIRFRMGGAGRVPLIVGLVAAGTSAVLETLQFVLPLGRVASVDDVLVNAVGAVLASLCSMRWWRARVGTRRRAREARTA